MFKKPFSLPQSKLFFGAIFCVIFVCLIAGSLKLLQSFDSSTVQFVSGTRTAFWNFFFLIITSLGNPDFIFTETALLACFFLFRNDMAHFFIFFGTISGNVLSVEILKNFVSRMRPENAIPVYQEVGFAFPSAHASISVVFYGLLAYLLAQKTKTPRTRKKIFFLWVLFLLLIGFSRLYLGVHFPSDIVAGYFVGGFWLCVGIIAFEELFSERALPRFLFWKRIRK